MAFQLCTLLTSGLRVLLRRLLSQVFTSDHALKLEWIPDWVAIIGSGYIGLEFADVYTALGSEVTLIEVRQQPCKRHAMQRPQRLFQFCRQARET